VPQAENLSDFYEFCKGLELARNFQFPTLRQVLFPCSGICVDINQLLVFLNTFPSHLVCHFGLSFWPFIVLQPPPSFLATMEEYVREAPRFGSGSSKALVSIAEFSTFRIIFAVFGHENSCYVYVMCQMMYVCVCMVCVYVCLWCVCMCVCVCMYGVCGVCVYVE